MEARPCLSRSKKMIKIAARRSLRYFPTVKLNTLHPSTAVSPTRCNFRNVYGVADANNDFYSAVIMLRTHFSCSRAQKKLSRDAAKNTSIYSVHTPTSLDSDCQNNTSIFETYPGRLLDVLYIAKAHECFGRRLTI